MKKIKHRYFFGLLAFIFSTSQLTQCNKEDKSLEKSKEASIISFELGTYKGKLNGTSFIIEVPYGADINSLSAKVKLSEKATIKPNPKTVKDWSNPVSFTVAAENGKDSKKYTVEVKILPPVLTFEKLTKKYTKGGHLNATEILKHVKGEKAGYTLKEITNLNPNHIVTVNGSAPNLRLAFNQVGVFTASLHLKQNATSDLDVTLSNAAFEITKGDAPLDLNWIKQNKVYRLGEEISNAEILAGLNGTKTGYTIKTVNISNAGGTGARVSGSGTSAKIVGYTRAGNLTLTLVFEHDTKADKTITGAQFELTSGAVSVPLSWSRQSKVYSSPAEIGNAELLGGVRGTKTGYRIKSVQITSDSGGSGARVSGSGTAAKIVSYGKATILTLTLALQHDTKAEKTLSNAVFEIRKMPVPADLSWRKQSKVYSSAREISNRDLLAGLTGTGKTGYRVKTLTISDARGTGARVSGNGTSAKIVGYTKAGTLTLSIVFEHDTKEDKNITGGAFEITKMDAPTDVTWTKQAKPFSSSGEITNTHLLAGVTGSGKTGYTIKTVTITNKNGTSARVSGSSTSAKITSYTKVGTLTLTLVLAHDTKRDVTLRNAQFEITKGGAESLTWTKQTKPFSSSGEISNAELLAGVTGSGKNGYTIKTVTITNKNGTSARVSGSGTSAKITSYNKVGTLTLTLVLVHDTKDDVTITGAQFHIYSYRDIFKISSAGEVTLKTSVDKKSLIIVTIPNTINGTTVTSIGNNAFYRCTSLTSITIPNSVTSIGKGAFSDCISLISITISNSVTTIENSTFFDCSSLTSITIPNSVTSIGNSVFSGCSSLTSITIPNRVTSIGWEIFRECTSLITIKLPNSITTIGESPFRGCSKLATIQVPNAKVDIWKFNLRRGNNANVVGY